MKQKTLKQRIQALEDIQAIKNLMGTYEYMVEGRRESEVPGLFATKAPGVRVELSGTGVYEGMDGVKKVFDMLHVPNNDIPGALFEHQLTTPVIEIAGDGKTAKGLWMSPGHETLPVPPPGKPIACWCWGKYAADFVKEDGQWKIWHFNIMITIHTPYDTSWVDHPFAVPPGFTPPPPDKPNTIYGWTYAADKVVPYYRPPEPYETFEDTFSY